MARSRAGLQPWHLFTLLLASVSAERTLTATALNCASVHPQCLSCAIVERKSASSPVWSLIMQCHGLCCTSKIDSYLACKTCTSPGYVPFLNNAVSPPKSNCACAPGYFSRDATPRVCEICPKGFFCPGGVGPTIANKNPCGSCLTTATTGSRNSSSCITAPGCAFKADTTTQLGFVGSPCVQGKYSAGGTRQACTACPSGLTTAGLGSTSMDACASPAGFYYKNRQALPCAQGSYKSGIDQATACTPCPVNITTPGVASESSASCSLAKYPGYIPGLDTNEHLVAKACAVGSYSSNGVSCPPCIDGLTTAREAATSAAECLAGPGYGYDATLVDTARTYKCADGTYKAGWNKNLCSSCGIALHTETDSKDGTGAMSADQCFILPGWGSSVSAAGTLVAKPCVGSTYGASELIYGVAAHPCQPCPEITVTPDKEVGYDGVAAGPYLSPAGCKAKPGYGWANNVATACTIGEYKEGYTNDDCKVCGTGLTTLANMADRAALCVPLPGWYKLDPTHDYAVPCDLGSYSAGAVGNAFTCTACPAGSTTEFPMSSDKSQCTVCIPGWGSNLAAGPGDSLCNKCVPGSFSPAGSHNECIACEADQTSPPGASDSSDCFDKFMSPAPYDYITTPSTAWVEATAALGGPSSAPTSAAECETPCTDADGCQYYVWRQEQDPEFNIPDGCFFKMAPVAPDTNTYVALKLWTGDYVVWQASAGECPQDTSNAMVPADASDAKTCLDVCDGLASCLAVYVTRETTGWVCHSVDGDFSTTGIVVSAVKAEPHRINLLMVPA